MTTLSTTLRRTYRGPRRPPQRRGAILVVALVCLLVVMSLVTGMIRSALRERRQLHQYRDVRQTNLLIEAGADRAAQRLANDPDYRGETWRVPAADIAGLAEGEVTIEVARNEPAENRGDATLRVHVVAEYPLVGPTSIRRSRTFIIASPTISEEE